MDFWTAVIGPLIGAPGLSAGTEPPARRFPLSPAGTALTPLIRTLGAYCYLEIRQILSQEKNKINTASRKVHRLLHVLQHLFGLTQIQAQFFRFCFRENPRQCHRILPLLLPIPERQ